MKINIFQNEEIFLQNILKEVLDYLDQSRGEVDDEITIGLAGGKTPANFYRLLGASELQWERLSFFPTDERLVPWNDPRSNFEMIKTNLFAAKPEQLKRFFDFRTELGSHGAIQDFKNRFQAKLVNGLDLVFLGIGPDGHFASIFPGTNLSEEDLLISSSTESFEVRERISFSAKVLLKSKRIIILLQGSSKRGLIEKIETESPGQFPAALLKNHQDCSVFFLDN